MVHCVGTENCLTEIDELDHCDTVDANGRLNDWEPRWYQPVPKTTPFLRAKSLSKQSAPIPRYWATEDNFTALGELPPTSIYFPPTPNGSESDPAIREYTPARVIDGFYFGILQMTMFTYCRIKHVASTFYSSLGWALLCGAVSNLYWLSQAHCGGCKLLLGEQNVTATLNTDVWDVCNNVSYMTKYEVSLSQVYDEYKYVARFHSNVLFAAADSCIEQVLPDIPFMWAHRLSCKQVARMVIPSANHFGSN